MDILGIGGWEFVAILIIMLIVAGPKRMIQWSYTLGKYVATLRKMWSETAAMLQKEFDDAGVDIKVPTQPPTRGSIKRDVAKALAPMTKPIQDTIDEVKQEVEPIKEAVSIPRTLGKPVTKSTSEETEPSVETQNGRNTPQQTDKPDFGTWSENSEQPKS
jgi:Sec-independent protein translocase protein TatA